MVLDVILSPWDPDKEIPLPWLLETVFEKRLLLPPRLCEIPFPRFLLIWLPEIFVFSDPLIATPARVLSAIKFCESDILTPFVIVTPFWRLERTFVLDNVEFLESVNTMPVPVLFWILFPVIVLKSDETDWIPMLLLTMFRFPETVLYEVL